MALTNKEKEQLNRMNFANGGSFYEFMTGKKKAKPSSSKFLFIGLGGKGSQTVAAIKNGVYQKIQCPEGMDRPENFEYLIIDTDEEEIKSLTQSGAGKVPLRQFDGEHVTMEAIQLFDKGAAVKLLPTNRKLLPQNIREWMNPVMNAELTGAGAGGIRQAGRYLLFGENAFKQLQNVLVNKLKNLQAQIKNAAKEKIIVYIFAGVGGGTGSGTIIDIPYIIRGICERNQWDVQLCGYIFMPDTYQDERTHQLYNSYAALKEIDTLMNIGQMGNSARFKATYVPGFSVDSDRSIFDKCVLVSGKGQNSGALVNKAMFSQEVVVEHIVNLVSDAAIQGKNGSVFLANSLLDNQQTEVSNAVAQLDSTVVPHNAYYQYSVIGAGEVILPLEQIMAYLAQKVMDKLETAWDKHPKDLDVSSFLEKLAMLPDEQANRIESDSEVEILRYVKGIGGPVDKKSVMDKTLYNILKNLWMSRNVALYNAWDVAKNKALETILKKFDEEYWRLFQDADAGFYYLRELLSSRAIEKAPFNGILERIKTDYFDSLEGLIGGQQELIRQCRERMAEIEKELMQTVRISFKSDKALIEEYRELAVGELAAQNRIELYDNIVRYCLKQIQGHMEQKAKEIQTYIDIFAYLKEIVDSNYQSVMDNSLRKEAYAIQLMDFSRKDEDTFRVLNYLDGMLAEETPAGLVTALERMMLDTEQQWINSEEQFEPEKVFVRFLESRFAQLPNLTIEKFLEIKYGENDINRGIKDICGELQSKSEVIFNTASCLSLTSLPTNSYVVIPAAAQTLQQQIASHAANYNGAQIAQGSNPNSIVWYNMVMGVPLFANSDMENYEKVYEDNTLAGMHLWENGEEFWKQFPALNNQKLWRDANQNPRERKLAEQIKTDTALFLEKGLIWQEKDAAGAGTGAYKTMCVQQDHPDLTPEVIKNWCEQKYLANPVKDADGMIDNSAGMWKRFCDDHSDLVKSYVVNIPTVYLRVNDGNLYQMLRMNIFLYRMLRETHQIYEMCSDIVRRAGARDRNSSRLYNYARTGIVQMQEDFILVEKKGGEQEALLYFENYTVLDNRFWVYWAVQQLTEKFAETDLKELDAYEEELSADHDAQAMAMRKSRSDNFMNECIKARDSLKKLETKKALQDAGKEAMISEYAVFYDKIINLRRG